MMPIQRIINQAKEDINTIQAAFEFVSKKEFTVIDGANTSSYIGIIDIQYSLWAYLSFNESTYLEFLREVVTQKIRYGFDGFKPMIKSPNIKATEIIDRLDYSIKYLNETFEIPLPDSVKPSQNWKGKISVLNEHYRIDALISELDFFIKRCENLFLNIEKTKAVKPVFEYKKPWIAKLIQNQFLELLDEMARHFENTGNKEYFIQTIQLNQRYNKLKSDELLGIKNSEELILELNKITKSIIEIIEQSTQA